MTGQVAHHTCDKLLDWYINNANSKSAFLKENTLKTNVSLNEFKHFGNKKQFDFNVSILNMVADVKDSLETLSFEDIEHKLEVLSKA